MVTGTSAFLRRWTSFEAAKNAVRKRACTNFGIVIFVAVASWLSLIAAPTRARADDAQDVKMCDAGDKAACHRHCVNLDKGDYTNFMGARDRGCNASLRNEESNALKSGACSTSKCVYQLRLVSGNDSKEQGNGSNGRYAGGGFTFSFRSVEHIPGAMSGWMGTLTDSRGRKGVYAKYCGANCTDTFVWLSGGFRGGSFIDLGKRGVLTLPK